MSSSLVLLRRSLRRWASLAARVALSYLRGRPRGLELLILCRVMLLLLIAMCGMLRRIEGRKQIATEKFSRKSRREVTPARLPAGRRQNLDPSKQNVHYSVQRDVHVQGRRYRS